MHVPVYILQTWNMSLKFLFSFLAKKYQTFGQFRPGTTEQLYGGRGGGGLIRLGTTEQLYVAQIKTFIGVGDGGQGARAPP